MSVAGTPLLVFVATNTGFPSKRKSLLAISKSSVKSALENGVETLVASNELPPKRGRNFNCDLPERVLVRFNTSTFENLAWGGTCTLIEKGDEAMIVPLTWSNQTFKFVLVELKPLPVITRFCKGAAFNGAIVLITGACAMAPSEFSVNRKN